MKEVILSEEEIVRRCNKGDRRAQEFLFNKFYKSLYLISKRYLVDHYLTEDAVILTFTRVFKNLKRFSYQGPGSLGKWIRTISINESLRLLKRNSIRFDDDLTGIQQENGEASGLEQLQAEDIMCMIEKLPTGYRTVFNLFAVEGYTHREIAGMLGITESTSKSQLKKARNSLITSINKERRYEAK